MMLLPDSSEYGSGENLFTNGSLNGTVTNGKVPDSWTLISSSLSPDVNNLENPAVGGNYNSAVNGLALTAEVLGLVPQSI